MHAILSQLSGLAGLFVFLARVWGLAPIESAVFTGVVTGIGVYLTLTLGDLTIRRIIIQNSSDPNAPAVSDLKQRHTGSPRPSDDHSRTEEPALANAAA